MVPVARAQAVVAPAQMSADAAGARQRRALETKMQGFLLVALWPQKKNRSSTRSLKADLPGSNGPAHAQQSSECNNDAKLHCLLKQGRPSFRLHNLHSSKMCVHNPENSGSCSASFASLRTRDLYGHLSIREVASKDGSRSPNPDGWLLDLQPRCQ